MATVEITGSSSSGGYWVTEVTYSTSFNDSNGTSSISVTQFRIKKGSTTSEPSTASSSTVTFSIAGTSYTSGSLSMNVPAGGGWSGYYSISKTVSGLTPSSSQTISITDDPWDKMSGSNTVTTAAKYTYTVSYAANGGTSTPSTQTKTWGTNLTLASAISHNDTTANGYTITWDANEGTNPPAAVTMINTTKYTFYRWKATNGTLYTAGGSYTTNAGTTMTAQWNTSVENGKLTALPTQPTRTNYTFQSWNTKADGTGYTLGTDSGYTLPYQPNANTTFYAIWKRNQASIKIKTGTNTWSDGLVWVKDSNGTWQRVLKVYVKTDATTWTESNN